MNEKENRARLALNLLDTMTAEEVETLTVGERRALWMALDRWQGATYRRLGWPKKEG